MPAPPDISIILLAANKVFVIVISPATDIVPVVTATLVVLFALLAVTVKTRLPVTVAVAVFTLKACAEFALDDWLMVTLPFTVNETPVPRVNELAPE